MSNAHGPAQTQHNMMYTLPADTSNGNDLNSTLQTANQSTQEKESYLPKHLFDGNLLGQQRCSFNPKETAGGGGVASLGIDTNASFGNDQDITLGGEILPDTLHSHNATPENQQHKTPPEIVNPPTAFIPGSEGSGSKSGNRSHRHNQPDPSRPTKVAIIYRGKSEVAKSGSNSPSKSPHYKHSPRLNIDNKIALFETDAQLNKELRNTA